MTAKDFSSSDQQWSQSISSISLSFPISLIDMKIGLIVPEIG